MNENEKKQNEDKKITKNFKDFSITKENIVCDIHGKIEGYKMQCLGKETFFCPICDKEKIEDDNKQKKERLKNQNIIYCKRCNIEFEYFDKTLEDYTPITETQKEALKSVKNLIENKKGKVILLGSNGVGKTFLGSMAVKSLGGKIYSMYEISTMIRQSYTTRAENTELEIVNELASIPMLVIDELGRTKGSEAEFNWLSYILDKRHTRQLPFMILSNKKLKKDLGVGCTDCFEKYFDNDVLSRLRDAKIITIDAPDYRARKN